MATMLYAGGQGVLVSMARAELPRVETEPAARVLTVGGTRRVIVSKPIINGSGLMPRPEWPPLHAIEGCKRPRAGARWSPLVKLQCNIAELLQ